MKSVRAPAVLCVAALSIAGCSLLVQPNEDRLREGGVSDAGSRPDVLRPDGSGMDVISPPPDVIEPPPDVISLPDATPDVQSTCPLGCNDGVECTDDRCNEALGRCEFTANPTRCAMGLVCNPAMGGCVAVACTGNGMCDDGNACNGAETCVMGRCQGGTALACDDGNACNGAETCDPRMGCQRGTALTCDDGRFCNGTETCDPARGCVAGTAPTCADTVACTNDTCNEATRRCEFVADGTRCPMGQVCNVMTGCVTMGCTTAAQCDDGNLCNGAEQCNAGRCVAGTSLRCDDGNVCNGLEGCDARMGCTTGAPLVCDDGLFCNGTETCDRARGCQPGAAQTCRDGNVCTSDACDPAANGGRGACVNTAIDADGDGFPAANVGGMVCAGRDCNDGDRAINPGAMEVCNGRDDNCNMMTDEGLMCTTPPANDQCAAAERVTLSTTSPAVTVMGTTLNATSQLGSRCGGDGQPDVFYAITFPAAADLRIEATGAMGVDPILQFAGAACGSSAVLACNDDQRNGTTASRLWVRASPIVGGATRTVIVAVDSFNAMTVGAFTLTATLQTPVAAGGCGTRFDVSSGGTVYHIVAPSVGTITGSCAPMGMGYTARGEQGYVFSGGAGAITGSATGFFPMLTVRDAMNCNAERGCAYNGMNSVTLMTAQTAGNIVIDGVPNNPGATYQYALEFKP